MNENLVQEALADRIVQSVAGAELGHCMRVDDIAEEDALRLAAVVRAKIDSDKFRVAVLASRDHGGATVTVETAVGIRNDKTHVFVLARPSGSGPRCKLARQLVRAAFARR